MITNPQIGMRVKFVDVNGDMSEWQNKLGVITSIVGSLIGVEFDQEIYAKREYCCLPSDLEIVVWTPEEKFAYQEQKLDLRRREEHAKKYL